MEPRKSNSNANADQKRSRDRKNPKSAEIFAKLRRETNAKRPKQAFANGAWTRAVMILLMTLAILAGFASAQNLKDLPETMIKNTDNVNIHGNHISCKHADGGACWGYDPTDKPFYKKKSFWVSEAIIVGSIWADNWSTERALHAGVAQESNPLIGKHPSDFKLRTVSIIGIGIESSLNIAMYELYSRQESSRGWRYSSEWGIAGVTAGITIPVVVHNVHVYNRQCAKAGLVCP